MNTEQLITKGVEDRLLSLSRLAVTSQDPKSVMKQYGALVAKNAAIPLNNSTAAQKAELAREAAVIFSEDIANNRRIHSMSMDEAIKAADYSDPTGNIGLLSGSLVMQKALPAMIANNPLLKSISTDFSGEPGLLNATDNTRIVLKPAVQTYDSTLDGGGRPLGWKTVSAAQTVDVPITISDYVGVPIVFGAGTLGSTPRNLFDEVAPLAISAIADYATAKLSALMTPANFNAYKGNSVTGGATTSGSRNITFTSSTNVFPGQPISGTGIPAGTYIASVESATAATITKAATATGSSLTFTLNNSLVPVNYTSYVKALANWEVADLDILAGVFDQNHVPLMNRFAALASGYYRVLGADANVNALMMSTGDATFLGKRRLPEISNFEMMNSPWFPQTSNRVGFAGHKAALVLKTRVPGDLMTALPGAAFPGAFATVTDPDTNLTVALVQYINPGGGYAEWRPEIMMGAAVGDRRAGLVITSA